jgi:hypothetical protein
MSGADLPVQLHLGRRPLPAKMRRPANHSLFMCKPSKALWTSSLIEPGRASWPFSDAPGWLLQPGPEARIVVLSGPADQRELAAAFPQARDPAYPSDVLDFFEQNGPAVDFRAVFMIYDAVRFEPDYRQPDSHHWSRLHGWDCESTAWGRWVFAGEAQPLTLSPANS